MSDKEKIKNVGSVKGLPEYSKPKEETKYYKLGREAGKKGKSVGDCPYPLTKEIIKLLIKRDQWIRGMESTRYVPEKHGDKKKKHKGKDGTR